MLAQYVMPTSHDGEDQASNQVAPAQYWSTVNEQFESESLSNLIIANDWLRAGDVVYSADRQAICLRDLCSAEDVILIMSQRAAKLAGDAAEGYPGVSDCQKRILGAAIAGWIALCCEPTFFGFGNVRKHVLTDTDLDAAARAVIGAGT